MGLIDKAREMGILPRKGMIQTAKDKGILPEGMKATFDKNRAQLEGTKPLDPDKLAQWEAMRRSDRSNTEE